MIRIQALAAGIQNPVIKGLVGKEQGAAPTIFGTFFGAIIGVLVIGGAIWAFIQLLLGGLGWISSGGDKGKLEEAQHKIRNAIVGLVVLFSVWAVYMLVLRFFGLSEDGTFAFPTLF